MKTENVNTNATVNNNEYTEETFEKHVEFFNELLEKDGKVMDQTEVKFEVGLLDSYTNAFSKMKD